MSSNVKTTLEKRFRMKLNEQNQICSVCNVRKERPGAVRGGVASRTGRTPEGAGGGVSGWRAGDSAAEAG